ncbi:hypothetical protein chiPu_0031813, partial [Chiloscyllium punctatum]|nr:hypothetical protein [Chiloscyllium punctatum]
MEAIGSRGSQSGAGSGDEVEDGQDGQNGGPITQEIRLNPDDSPEAGRTRMVQG